MDLGLKRKEFGFSASRIGLMDFTQPVSAPSSCSLHPDRRRKAKPEDLRVAVDCAAFFGVPSLWESRAGTGRPDLQLDSRYGAASL